MNLLVLNLRQAIHTECRREILEMYFRTIYWKIEQYSVSPIWKDNEWWVNNKHMYTSFWEKVLNDRKIGYESLIKPVKKRLSIKKPVTCLITDD